MPERQVRQITLRIPDPLYAKVKGMAKRQRRSFNSVAIEQLETLAAAERDRELRAAYDLVAADADGANVEDFAAAQREALDDE